MTAKIYGFVHLIIEAMAIKNTILCWKLHRVFQQKEDQVMGFL